MTKKVSAVLTTTTPLFSRGWRTPERVSGRQQTQQRQCTHLMRLNPHIYMHVVRTLENSKTSCERPQKSCTVSNSLQITVSIPARRTTIAMTALHKPERQPSTDLPDVATFASFQSLSRDGKTIRDPAPSACVVSDFIFSKSRWATFPNRSGTQLIGESATMGETSRSEPSNWTLAEILSENIRNWPCALCGKKGESCLGNECVQRFRQNSQDAVESLEIRHGDDAQHGVYCKGDGFIPAGSILGEYIGEVSQMEYLLLPTALHDRDLIEYTYGSHG